MSEEKGKRKGCMKAETGLPQWMTEDGLLYSMKERPIEIEVELPQWLSRAADEKGIDLSEVLEDALRKKILKQSEEQKARDREM